GERPHAAVVLKENGSEKRAEAQGDGPVDATFKAIESIARSGADLLLYSVNAVTTGTESQGEVTVRLATGGRIVKGVGADAALVQGRSGENPRHAAHGDERAERPARGRNGRRDQPPLRAHGAGVHEDPVRAARRQAGREPRPAARGVARAGSRLCVTRRTWLFVPGADQAAHRVAARSGADVIVLELEDFTPPELRPKARSLSPRTLELWRKAGAIPAVRINPLQSGGLEDLMGVLAARPQIIMMAKVALPEQVQALEQATGGAVELVPNVESAEGLLRAYQIAKAS